MNSDNLLLLGLKSSVTAISRSDGRTLWKTELAGGLNNSFVTVLSDGYLVFAHSGGTLYCLDLANGQILWSNGLSGYGYGFASLCFPGGRSAPDSAIIEKIVSDRRSST
jgi:outer membrane protein assembly factor BamB